MSFIDQIEPIYKEEISKSKALIIEGKLAEGLDCLRNI